VKFLYQNKFEGNEFSAVGFQMLEGLQTGQNLTWDCFCKKISILRHQLEFLLYVKKTSIIHTEMCNWELILRRIARIIYSNTNLFLILLHTTLKQNDYENYFILFDYYIGEYECTRTEAAA
jgi:hypothetical protein